VRTAYEFIGINRNMAILYFHKLREIIADQIAAEASFLAGVMVIPPPPGVINRFQK
jgi:hypothetical protein